MDDLKEQIDNLSEEMIPEVDSYLRHRKVCGICNNFEVVQRVNDMITRGASANRIAEIENLDIRSLKHHIKFLSSLPKVQENLTSLIKVTPQASYVLPLQSVLDLRNFLIPTLINSLIAKVGDPKNFTLAEGTMALDVLIKMLNIIQMGDVSKGTEIPDARQLAIGKLSEVYDKASTEEEKKGILQTQRELLEALRKSEKVIEGSFVEIN